eukprot:Unigene12627_Nuclearia_a/m.38358 Unigene12627_Nuclearia_a/g.38358  ORF Unigene12627_Nuclearia_a/g.38358 Unigene12627_Nuclearia_a/m.38358 type:complete len:350 (+) Unigene12627_Nuclearia_a:37-1086(+)
MAGRSAVSAVFGDDTDEEVCPSCLGSTLFSPNMRLLVSPCCHKLCESCVKLKFSASTAPCPVCGELLRRSDYVAQTFEDLVVDKEVRVRKRLTKLYNKREEDFVTLREYNDYLEEVEEMVFNLVNNVDVGETNRRIEAFRQKNEELIRRNRAIDTLETRQLSDLLDKERRELDERDRADLALIKQEQQDRVKERDGFIEDLARASQPVLQRTTKTLKAPSRRDGPGASGAPGELQADTSGFTMSYMDKLHGMAVQKAGPGVSVATAVDAKRTEDERLQREMQEPFDPLETCHFDRPDHGSLARFFDPSLAALHNETHGVARAGGFLSQLAYHRALDATVVGLMDAPVGL